jgi:peroxiredoxin
MLRILLQYFSYLFGKTAMPTLSAGKSAPPFQLSTLTGERLSLAQSLAEGPVLLAFFKVSCPTCQFTFPFLERIQQQLRERGAQIWGIVQDRAKDGARFAAAYGVTFPILVDDAPYEVSRAYGLSHVPSLFLVKQDGSIEIVSEGFAKADLLSIHRTFAQTLSITPAALFGPNESVPEFKPG